MDYIREELLRQRAALAALLLGGAGREDAREDGPGTAGEVPPAPTPARGRGGERGRETTAAGTGPDSWAGTETVSPADWERAAERAGGGREAVGFGGTPGDGSGPDGAAAWVWGPGLAGTGAPGRGWTLAADGAGPAVVTAVTELALPQPEAAPGPEALSRAFQQDARRYDGGFFLY